LGWWAGAELDGRLAQWPVARKVLVAPLIAVTAVLVVAMTALLALLWTAQSDRRLDTLAGQAETLQEVRASVHEGHRLVLRDTLASGDAWATRRRGLAMIDDGLAELDALPEPSVALADGNAYRALAAQLANGVGTPTFTPLRLDDAFGDFEAKLVSELRATRIELEILRRGHERVVVGTVGLLLLAALVGPLVTFVAARRSARAIADPLRRITERTVQLARGQLSLPIPERGRADEIGAIASALDVFRGTAEALHRQAYLDPLTGLANRPAFMQQLERALDEQRRYGREFAVLLLDLDHFKEVNDSLGHATGDRLLVEMAGRLRAAVRQSDTLARLGGDEFAIVQAELRPDLTPERVAQRIVDAAGQPFDFDGQAVFVGTSIGIASCPGDGQDADTLMRHADLALYEAKREGRDGWRFFTHAMHTAVVERRALELDFRQALEAHDVSFAFQPKFTLEGRRLVGIETLARWVHPERGVVPTERFLEVARSTGLTEPLGSRALETALAATARWLPRVGSDFTVSVNLAIAQLRRTGFVMDVEAALERAGLEPGRLSFEVSESVFAADDPTIIDTLRDLGDLGVRLALDDFGTGYASLRHLNRVPFDELKIDRSFVREVAHSSDAAAIVRAIVAVGRALELVVTAEGIETEAQRGLLLDAGAMLGQGFLLGPPMPSGALETLLELRPREPAAIRDR
jgi:diguanylate cyclase (GGDEF)-like protein